MVKRCPYIYVNRSDLVPTFRMLLFSQLLLAKVIQTRDKLMQFKSFIKFKYKY